MKQFISPLTACFIGLSVSAALANEGSLIVPDQANANVEVTMKNDALAPVGPDTLQVFVGSSDACCDGKSPIAGKYHVEGRRVVFDPAFDFIEGQSYTVRLQDVALSLTEFVIDAEGSFAIPEVIGIYPSGDTIPENTLRFYIYFSTPMTPHLSGDFIKLIDANGTADTEAFMMFTQELWNQDRTRLTLLMDPGRIKRGVAQNQTLGPALLEGNRYSIVIEDGWPSARGGYEAARFEKSFIVSPPLRSLPDTDLWQFQRPKAESRDALVISFDRPFDLHLSQVAITVRDAEGQLIAGTVSVEDFEQTWRFVPDDLWATSTVSIGVDARLEDVAGNNFKDLLDHSVGTAPQLSDQQTINLDLMASP